MTLLFTGSYELRRQRPDQLFVPARLFIERRNHVWAAVADVRPSEAEHGPQTAGGQQATDLHAVSTTEIRQPIPAVDRYSQVPGN
jgi:hypothetical protein